MGDTDVKRSFPAHGLLHLPGTTTRHSGRTRHDMALVLDYMSSHLGRRMQLADLARLWSVRKDYFCRAFKLATGVPPGQYLRILRLETAKSLLETTDLSVKEIRACSGFNDPSHFTREFKKLYGVTPTEHRARILDHKWIREAGA